MFIFQIEFWTKLRLKFPAFGVGEMLPVKLTPTIFCVLFSLNFTRYATQKRPMKSMALAYVDTIQYLVPWHKYLLNNIDKERKKKEKKEEEESTAIFLYLSYRSFK
jgi:hypothetical protein